MISMLIGGRDLNINQRLYELHQEVAGMPVDDSETTLKYYAGLGGINDCSSATDEELVAAIEIGLKKEIEVVI